MAFLMTSRGDDSTKLGGYGATRDAAFLSNTVRWKLSHGLHKVKLSADVLLYL
jgi:hypothetical protein